MMHIPGQKKPEIIGTTVLLVRREGKVVMAGDGQVTIGNQVLKHKARKVRRLYHDRIITGFAGATADALTLYERFEKKLESHGGNLRRAAVELAKDWRTDKMLRRLEALMVVADKDSAFLISGSGDVRNRMKEYWQLALELLMQNLPPKPF